MLNIALSEKLGGQFTLRKRDVRTGKVVQEVGPFSNLITDLGLNRLGTAGPQLSHCYVGTGTVPPAVTDTTMSTFKVTSNSAETIQFTSPVSPSWFAQVSRTFKFNAGTISGNITEVGVGWSNSPVNALWSRELIVDSSGNPIAITVLPTETLEVVYTLRHYLNVNDFAGSFELNAITYNYTGRIYGAGSHQINVSQPQAGPCLSLGFTGATALGSISATPGLNGTPLTGGVGTAQAAYVNNSYTKRGESFLSTASWNAAGGANAFTLNAGSASSFMYVNYQVLLDKAIPKTNLNTVSMVWSISWERYTPPVI